MVAELQNHWKTIGTNGFSNKTIGKLLLPMVLETKNHGTTIDINGGFPTIYSMAMVSMKTFKCCNGGNHKANVELKWIPRDTFVTLGWVSLSKVCLPLCICSTNHVFLRFGLFCEPEFTFPKTIDKPLMSMVSHKPLMQWQWFNCKNHWKNHPYQWFRSEKPLKNHWH